MNGVPKNPIHYTVLCCGFSECNSTLNIPNDYVTCELKPKKLDSGMSKICAVADVLRTYKRESLWFCSTDHSGLHKPGIFQHESYF